MTAELTEALSNTFCGSPSVDSEDVVYLNGRAVEVAATQAGRREVHAGQGHLSETLALRRGSLVHVDRLLRACLCLAQVPAASQPQVRTARVEALFLNREGHHSAREVVTIEELVAHGVGTADCGDGIAFELQLAVSTRLDAGQTDMRRPLLWHEVSTCLSQTHCVVRAAIPVGDKGLQSTNPGSKTVMTSEFAAHESGTSLRFRRFVSPEIEAGVSQDTTQHTCRNVQVSGVPGRLAAFKAIEGEIAKLSDLAEKWPYWTIRVVSYDPMDIGFELF
ncbi:hypothetical protein [Streptomyces sp. NPDC007063]|uniref:hypothetical protein n=1 Tax=Streptomyces sp. NPDC007063 TaxID=3364772 RepID=UPI0036A7E1AB